MDEFKTAKEADDMVRGLYRASRYCTGPSSSERHSQRIREVEAERDRLLNIEQERQDREEA